MALSGSAKELKPLVDAIKKNGFKVVPSGKHHKIVDVEGKLGAKNKVVTDGKGPILISSTPGDFRARDMHVKRLLDRGVITKDPWAKDKGEGKEGRAANVTSPEARAKARERIAEESKRRHERTLQLRSRIEPIVTKLGGWERRGMVTELGRTAFHFLEDNNRSERWKTEAGALQNANQLRKGNTLSDQAVDAWNLFADELEKAWRRGPGTSPNDEALRERYFELVRAGKGIKDEPKPDKQRERRNGPVHRYQMEDRQEPEPEPEAAAAPERRNGAHVGPLSEKLPTVALKAVFLMSQDRRLDQMDEVLEVGEEILRLEIASIENDA